MPGGIVSEPLVPNVAIGHRPITSLDACPSVRNKHVGRDGRACVHNREVRLPLFHELYFIPATYTRPITRSQERAVRPFEKRLLTAQLFIINRASASVLDSKPRTRASAVVMGGAFVVNAVRTAATSKRFNAQRSKAVSHKKRNILVRASGDASTTPTMFFAGDIGGTNARLQVWTVGTDGTSTLTFEKTYGTSDHPTFESCVSDLYKDSGIDKSHVSSACFAVAGPVADDRCAMTNIDWVVDGPALSKMFDIDAVKVINDFAAVGYGVLDLKKEEIVTLNEGTARDAKGPVTVLGPGTGLGEAMLFWNNETSEYDVVPSEGSHADFAPRGDTQRALQKYCETTLGECEIEQVCCGSGIVRIYEFLKTYREGAGDKPELDPAGVTTAALDSTCEVAKEAVDIFLEILGAEAANLALKCLATGGVYVGGGIPPRLLSEIEKGGMLDAYLHKACRYTDVRKGFPLHIILNDKIGLAGAKVFALRQL